MNTILDAMNWRYATKKFDASFSLSSEQIESVEEVLRLTPSSFGLQPWNFVIIPRGETTKSLVAHAYGQDQVGDASHLIVLTRKNTLDASLVETYISDIISQTGAPAEALAGYKDMMLGFVSNMPAVGMETWAEKQVYIALGNIMTALAAMEIDACPMEGFSKEGFNSTLGLTDMGLSSVVILPIGKRADNDEYAHRPKIRYNKKDIITHLS